MYCAWETQASALPAWPFQSLEKWFCSLLNRWCGQGLLSDMKLALGSDLKKQMGQLLSEQSCRSRSKPDLNELIYRKPLFLKANTWIQTWKQTSCGCSCRLGLWVVSLQLQEKHVQSKRARGISSVVSLCSGAWLVLTHALPRKTASPVLSAIHPWPWPYGTLALVSAAFMPWIPSPWACQAESCWLTASYASSLQSASAITAPTPATSRARFSLLNPSQAVPGFPLGRGTIELICSPSKMESKPSREGLLLSFLLQ